jgi:hypothetical protein
MLQVDIAGVLERSASGEPSIVVTAPGREVGASTRGPIWEDLARRQASSPCQYPEDPGIWLYRGYVVKVTGTPADQDELALRIEHAVLRQRKALDRLRRELQAGTETPGDQETIPEDVRLLVWQRTVGAIWPVSAGFALAPCKRIANQGTERGRNGPFSPWRATCGA